MRISFLLWMMIARVACASCYATPQLAVRAIVDSSISSASNGFRAIGFQTDPLTGAVWVRVQQCEYPNRTPQLFPLHMKTNNIAAQGPEPSSLGRVFAVKAGNPVRIYWSTRNAHLQLQGTAEQNGNLGEVIGVKISSFDTTSSAATHIRARISGPGEVEYLP